MGQPVPTYISHRIGDADIDDASPQVAYDDAHPGTGKVLRELVDDRASGFGQEPVAVETMIESRGHGILQMRHVE